MSVSMPAIEPALLGEIVFRGTLSWWIAGPLIVLSLVAVFVIYFRESMKLHPAVRMTMGVLRGLALTAIILLLMKPVLIHREESRKRDLPIVVLVDASQSMAQADPRTSPDDRMRLAIARKIVPPDHGLQMKADGSYGNLPMDEPTRAEVVSAVFQNNDPKMNLLARLRDKGPVQEFLFGKHVFGAGNDWVQAIPADQPRTALLRSLNELLERKEGDRPAAIVLVSDGRDNDKDEKISWDTIRAKCKQLQVPVYVYAVGAGTTGVLQLKALNLKSEFSIHDTVSIPVKWRAQGLPNGKLEISATLNGRNVLTEPVIVDVENAEEVLKTISFKPREEDGTAGRQELVVSIKLVGGREVDKVTKTIRFTDKKVKVLYVENVPRWEFKFLLRAFQRDKMVEPTFHLIEGDKKTLEAGPPFIPAFPNTRKEVFAYDLIVIGDVDSKFFTAEQREWIREFVEKGGGLVLIAGKKHAPASYLNTPIGDMLPVEFEAKSFPVVEELRPLEYHPQLSTLGQLHPLMSLSQSRDENTEIWKKLPGWYWHYPVKKLKPAAMSLLEHPKEEIEAEGGKKRPMPLMAIQQYGKGQVFFSGVDETWRWRFNEAETYFGRFWGQIVYAIGLSNVVSGRSNLMHGGGEPTLGNSSKIFVSLFTPDNQPLKRPSVNGKLEWLDAQSDEERVPQNIVFEPVLNQPGEYVATVSNNHKGRQRVTITDNVGPVSSLEYPVNPDKDHELSPGDFEEAELNKLGVESGGGYYREENLFELPDKVSTRTAKIENLPPSEVLLWKRWWVLAIVIGLFSVEWLVRKMSNLS
jgi:hypothetical protein